MGCTSDRNLDSGRCLHSRPVDHPMCSFSDSQVFPDRHRSFSSALRVLFVFQAGSKSPSAQKVLGLFHGSSFVDLLIATLIFFQRGWEVEPLELCAVAVQLFKNFCGPYLGTQGLGESGQARLKNR